MSGKQDQMPKITFIEHSGTTHEINANSGQSVMQVAMSNRVPGIIADCGGSCSCATCHVYVDEAWFGRIPAATSAEKDMIDCALHVQENSRLSCQIEVKDELDGLVVRLPESQT
jgi:2Fe-2S ferredoxin